jgi:soluble lytic murein transglycosylase
MTMRMKSVVSVCVALSALTIPVVAGGLDGLFGFVTPTKTAAISQANAQAGITQYSSSDLQAMKSAIAAYKAGDIAKGDQLSTPLGASIPGVIAEWAAIRSQGSQLGFDRISRFLANYPDWPTQSLLRRRAEEALVAEKQPHPVIRSFFAKQQPVTPGGGIALAEAMAANGQTTQAIDLVRHFWASTLFKVDLEQRYLASFGEQLRRADHLKRFERGIFSEDGDVALRAAQRLGPEEIALARAAQSVFDKSGPSDKLLSAVPAKTANELTGLYVRVKALRRSDRLTEAANLLVQIPHGTEAREGGLFWVERRLIARKLLDMNQAQLAYKVAAGHSAQTIPDKVEADFTAGWIMLRVLNHPDQALRHFDQAAKEAKTPISVARASYWQGRAAEAMGRNASSYYQHASAQGGTYYGQLARAHTGQSGLPIANGPQGSVHHLAQRIGIQGLATLYAADERALALTLVNDLAYSLPDAAALDALADLTTAYGDAAATLSIAKIATQRNLPLGQHAFPLFGIPQQALNKAPIEQAFVYAITRQESAFDPQATSTSGAKGLMQLMPATAKIEAGKVGVEFDASRLTDPHYNVTLGAAHLGRLVENYNGSYILAIAAYNAGPGNVKKWVDAFGDPRDGKIDPVDWVERIPFTETRNYVQRVLENLQVYRSKIGNQQSVMIEKDLQRGAR